MVIQPPSLSTTLLIDRANLNHPLTGEVALVTGAGRGIGRESALILARLGAGVIIAEATEAAFETADTIRAAGGTTLAVQVDVSDPRMMQTLHDRAIEQFQHIDIVINNACVFYAKPLLHHSVEEWDRVMAVNLRGAFLAAKLFLPGMLARRHGVFVTMESGDGMPYLAPYFASKVALRSLAMSVSQEVGADAGGSVFCFGAGMVDTPGIRLAVPKLASLYGMTAMEFISQSAPGGSLLSAEQCATGLVGCVLNAAQFHGEETAAPAGLALLGLGGSAPEPATQVQDKSSAAPAGRLEAAEAIAGLVRELRHEYDGLGMFQRQWYRRMLKGRTGLSLEDWEAASESLTELASLPSASPAAYAGTIAKLHLLAAYFEKLESEARGFMKDPAQLEQALAALVRRRTAADQAAAALGASAEA
jgi:NAD(P)-dependent dehydrogenase (short-subunit alcohol dehydrogenase family)